MGFQLPNINTPASKQSPFKGFLDISIVTQKLRKEIRTSGGEFPENFQLNTERAGRNNHNKGTKTQDNLELI